MPLEGLTKSYQQYKGMGERTTSDIKKLGGGKVLSLIDQLNELAETPGVDVGVPLAFTKTQTTKPFIQWLFSNYGKGRREEIAQSLRVIGKAPKKTIEDLKWMDIDPRTPTTAFYRRYGPFDLGVPKKGKLWTQHAPGSGNSWTMPELLGHELGHGSSWRILERLGGKNPRKVESLYDTIQEGEFEGIADYLGKHLASKTGSNYRLVFPYGKYQKQGFEDLSKMPSRNPYMNVYRYLQKMMRSK